MHKNAESEIILLPGGNFCFFRQGRNMQTWDARPKGEPDVEKIHTRHISIVFKNSLTSLGFQVFSESQMLKPVDYSCLRASIGSIIAARRAGYRPAITPTNTDTLNATMTEKNVTTAFTSAFEK